VPCKGNCGEKYVHIANNSLTLCDPCLKKLADVPYEAPPGFIPSGRDARSKYVITQGDDSRFTFDVANATGKYRVPGEHPTLPFKDSGELWMTGWDIPITYVVDASGQCWKTGGHGGYLYRCLSQDLLSDAEAHADKVQISKACGLPPPLSAFEQGSLDMQTKLVKALTDAGFAEAAALAASLK
jgi:hypothetical protein